MDFDNERDAEMQEISEFTLSAWQKENTLAGLPEPGFSTTQSSRDEISFSASLARADEYEISVHLDQKSTKSRTCYLRIKKEKKG